MLGRLRAKLRGAHAGNRARFDRKRRPVTSRHLLVPVRAQLVSHSGDGEAAEPSALHTLAGKLATGALVTITLITLPAVLPTLPGGPGGGGGGSSGFGGGGGGGGSWQHVLPHAKAASTDEDEEEEADGDEEEEEEDDDEEDDDDDEEDEDDDAERSLDDLGATESEMKLLGEELKYMTPPPGTDKSAFYCQEVKAEGLPKGRGCPTPDELFASLNCQPGFWVPKNKLQQDLEILRDSGMFKEVDVKVMPLRAGSRSKCMRAIFTFKEKIFPAIQSFHISDSKCLPPDMNERVMSAVKKHHNGQPTGLAVLTTIRTEIENWYNERGFNYSQLRQFEGLETGNIRLSVSEPRIRKINVQFVDENMQELDEGGHTPVDLIRRTMSLRQGQFYSSHDGRNALQEAFTLQAFENAQILPEFVPSKDDMLDVTVMLKERPVKSMDTDLEWGLASLSPKLPLPIPVSIVPGGSLNYEDRSFGARGDQVQASLQCTSFLHPTDDLSLRAQFRRPYVFGKAAEEDGVIDAFNSRRLSSVFAGSRGGTSVPPVWIERAGVRLGLEKHLSRHSRSNLGLVVEQVKTRDDSNGIVTHGALINNSGGGGGTSAELGPPTTLSSTGVDKSVHAQLSVVRDTTFLVNGGLVGSRDTLEVNQGLGLGSGIFNRYKFSITRFLKLNTPSTASPLQPFVLVLHGQHGNALGPHAAYDYHVLGGPHSCRAFSLGELGPARSFVEGAAELRAPVPYLKTHAFAYAEHARDLGRPEDLSGCPRTFYSTLGRGTSVGVGVKLGVMRAEFSRDCNRGTATWFMHFGERF